MRNVRGDVVSVAHLGHELRLRQIRTTPCSKRRSPPARLLRECASMQGDVEADRSAVPGAGCAWKVPMRDSRSVHSQAPHGSYAGDPCDTASDASANSEVQAGATLRQLGLQARELGETDERSLG